MKTDYLGNELKIGDTVAFMQIGYRGLMKGVITKMSEQKAAISHEKTNTYKTESIQYYKQMVKVNISDNDYAKCPVCVNDFKDHNFLFSYCPGCGRKL